GIRYWGWDAFQLLILYWTETLILAAWTMVRIARLPEDRLGTMTVNGKVVNATHRMMVGFFSLHAGMFVAAHLLFLCLLFSGVWLRRLRGVGFFFPPFSVPSGGGVAVLAARVLGGGGARRGGVPSQAARATQRGAGGAPAYTFTSGSGANEK